MLRYAATVVGGVGYKPVTCVGVFDASVLSQAALAGGVCRPVDVGGMRRLGPAAGWHGPGSGLCHLRLSRAAPFGGTLKFQSLFSWKLLFDGKKKR